MIQNGLTLLAEELLPEEQAGLRPFRSTVEEILNSHILIEERLQHDFDFKNASRGADAEDLVGSTEE